MSVETDLLIDRRRLKRRLLFWRLFAVLAVVVCALLLVGGAGGFGGFRGGAHVARLDVNGVITEDARLIAEIRAVAKDDSAKALILRVDSPGGSVAGGESIYAALKAVAAKKPVVTVMGGLAASAGYMISMPAERVFARGTTITGSIGVILETGEASGLMSKVGLTAEAITSGPLKDQPSYTKPLSPEGRDVLHGLVNDMFDQFVDIVAAGRKMTPDQVRALADGRAYSGRQALKLGLVDEIGGEEEARAWLAKAHGVSADLPVRQIGRRGWVSRTFGNSADGLLGITMKTLLSQGVTLDGAMALWQPSLQSN